MIENLGLIEQITGATNENWVEHVYENVVGEAPDAAALALFTGYLDSGQRPFFESGVTYSGAGFGLCGGAN